MDLNPTRTESYNTAPTVVHSTRHQLQACAPIICAIKAWAPQDYNLFIEGLLSFPDERDVRIRIDVRLHFVDQQKMQVDIRKIPSEIFSGRHQAMLCYPSQLCEEQRSR